MSEVVTWLDTIGRVFEGIPDLAAPDEVEAALSEILEDPLLQLYWWDWELERYVDVRGVFTGHEICSSSWWPNSLSWPVEESYHPNRAGQQSGYLPALRAVIG